MSTPAAAPEAREPTMICQFCKDDGERSRITIGGGCSSALTHAPYYDEDGEWVQPPSEVWDMTGYRCSRGHDWRVRRQHGKPDEIIADETAVTAAPARPAPQGAPDLDALIANLRTVPHGVFSRGHDNGEKLPVGEWCRDAVTALATLRAQALAGAEDRKRWTEDELRELLIWALNQAWSDFTEDTGCYPDCISVIRQRGKPHVVEADFGVSNFSRFAAGWLAMKLNETRTPERAP